MPENPPAGTPRISPYLLYEDATAAVAWLSRAFGFVSDARTTMRDGEGHVRHAELRYQEGVVMLGHPGPDYRSPRSTGHSTVNVYVYVDDVDAHYRQAVEAGATVVEEPTDTPYGDRRYGAEDPEGHRWYFATHVRDAPGA